MDVVDTWPGIGAFYLHKQGTKRRVHDSRSAAEAEARRLSATVGETFVITQEVGRIVPGELSE